MGANAPAEALRPWRGTMGLLYCTSSFTYSLAAVCFYLHPCHGNFGLSSIYFLQGFVSYWNDVLALGENGVASKVDIGMAWCSLVSSFVYACNYVYTVPVSVTELVVFYGTFAFGLYAKLR